MGQVTPNIGIYIPAAGETNYDAAFAAGMVNIDQHDHSGGPNKGVPITTTGIADDSITYQKLNSNVADNTTGVGTNGALPNQLVMLGLLKNIYQVATTAGFLTKDGANAHARTFQDTSQITWINPDGSGGDPSASMPTSFFQEGTWTPGFKGSVTPGTMTYTLQYGTYQRIGSWVDCYGYIKVNAISVAMAGDLQITGLPFTADNTSLSIYMGIVDPAAQTATTPTTPGGTFPFVRVAQGTTDMTLLFYNPTSGGDNTYNSAMWNAGDDLAIRIRYKI